MLPSNLVDHPKRKKFAWLVFGVVLILGLALAAAVEGRQRKDGLKLGELAEILEPTTFQEKLIEGEGEDKVVLIRAEGVLYDVPADELSGRAGIVPIERVVRQFNQAEADGQVKAVIVLINSPGGTVTASQTIAEKIAEFKKSGKKVIVLMREVAASGGYFIATPADKIVANGSTITGSIGVIVQTANLEKLYQKIGYQPITFKAGRLKDIGSSDRPITEEERQIIQQLIDEEHEVFKKFVAEGRKLGGEKINQLADGRIFSGRQAKELGLVDDLGNLSKAIELAKKEAGMEKASIVEYTTPFGLIGRFFNLDFIGSSSIESIAKRLIERGELVGGVMYLWTP